MCMKDIPVLINDYMLRPVVREPYSLGRESSPLDDFKLLQNSR